MRCTRTLLLLTTSILSLSDIIIIIIMPSRPLPPQPLPASHHHHHHHNLLPPLAAGITATFSLLILFTLFFRKLSHKQTAPSPSSPPPHHFSYSSLRRATSSFSPSHLLGNGGFGSVFSATLPNYKPLAVKLMHSHFLEFQNELLLSSKVKSSDHIVSLLGFSSNPKRRRMLLVYEFMPNGSLQDCLFRRKCVQLKNWEKRFSIASDIAKGLEFLHHFCDPPIIHADVKPSNVLLDADFRAKIGDFGLARVKSENCVEIDEKREGELGDNGSVVEETDSVITTMGFDGVNGNFVEASPESVVALDSSPEVMVVVSPRTVADMVAPLDGFEESSGVWGENANLDKVSVDSGKRKFGGSGKDWWWKQDNGGGGGESGSVKDYVMEWIGNEIRKEKPKSEWVGGASSSSNLKKTAKNKGKKNNRKRLDWWSSLDEEKNVNKNEKRRPAREWWREEYAEELARKKKKKKREGGSVSDGVDNSDNYWPKDEELSIDRKKKRSRSRGSNNSVDWWFDGVSGELSLWRGRGKSFDTLSGEIAKSGGVSSTPSMRGTVCYIAPEYSGGGDLSEKCDVYSFGVLLLVLIAGRRPLQVTGSPMSEFQRANLLSWTRHLARAGKLLDLVDQSIECLDKEQALLCITVALLCLQKLPACRPSMKEVVGMLSGGLEQPQIPVEFSTSPPYRHRFKSHKKIR